MPGWADLRWLLLEGVKVTDADLRHIQGFQKLEFLGATSTGVTLGDDGYPEKFSGAIRGRRSRNHGLLD